MFIIITIHTLRAHITENLLSIFNRLCCLDFEICILEGFLDTATTSSQNKDSPELAMRLLTKKKQTERKNKKKKKLRLNNRETLKHSK